MTDLRTAAEQALEAMRRAVPTGKITLYEWDKAVSDLDAALAQQTLPVEPVPLKRGITGRCTRKVCECEKEGLGPECIHLEPVIEGYPLWSGIPKAEPVQKPAPEPAHEQDIEDAIEAAYWHFDARKKGLNEWASAPQSERDAFKAEARKLAKGYFPTRQAQDTKREMLAVADAFIRGKRAALAQQAEPEGGGNLPPPLQVPTEVAATLTTTDIAWLETRRLTKLWQELGQMRWAGVDEGWDRAIEAVRSRLNDECQAVLDWKAAVDQSNATAIELLQKMQGVKDD